MIILGIDPGTTRMGYGIISTKNKLNLIESGVIGNKNGSKEERLYHIHKELKKLIEKYKPEIIGIEEVYFSKNKKTALLIAEARGVVLSLSRQSGVRILEFTPSNIKSMVAGDGRCDKKTLARVVAITLGVKEIPGPDDISDALAIAIRTSFEVKQTQN